MRKLASIQRIAALELIEGADAILRAKVLGWQLAVKKHEFQVGDLCVYCEVDSLMPNKPEFAFLQPRGMRIKTIRLRGQISQGICFPLSILPETVVIEEGVDVTEILGITKYEPPIPTNLAGKVRGNFPSYIPKTDETRVQVLQQLLNDYQGEVCYVAEKLDGSSVTYYFKNGHFGVCSRNLELLETPDSLLWQMARELKMEQKLQVVGKNLALQGEIIGQGVQGNKYDIKGNRIYFFNWFDIDEQKYLDIADMLKGIEALSLESVPILTTEYQLEKDIDSLVALSIGKSLLNPKVYREGIVIRPIIEHKAFIPKVSLGRLSFKVINPEFLLKYD